MSEPWSKLRDVDLLADGRAEFAIDIPLASFPRLTPKLARAEGCARGTLRFTREFGFAVADVALDALLELVCQRCLGPMDWPVAARTRVALLADPDTADRVPEEIETMHAPAGRTRLLDIVEEELLLSLPVVALHERGACDPPEHEMPEPEEREAQQDVQRPFERLGELLKRDQ